MPNSVELIGWSCMKLNSTCQGDLVKVLYKLIFSTHFRILHQEGQRIRELKSTW